LTPAARPAPGSLETLREPSHAAKKAFINQWHAYIKNAKRTTNDPMEAITVGFNLWVKARRKAQSPRGEGARRAARPRGPNLTGAYAKVCPITTSPSRFLGEVRRTVSSTSCGKAAARRRVMPGQIFCLAAGYRGRLGDTQVRQLQHQDQGVLGTELQVERKRLLDRPHRPHRPDRHGHPSGRGARQHRERWRSSLLLAALLFAPPALAQSRDGGFLAALGELRRPAFSTRSASSSD